MACNNCDEHHIASHDIDNGDGEHQRVTVFPREPSWWRDDTENAEQQRQHIFHDFDQTELVTLIDEVWMYVQNPPETVDEVAQLIRRLLSLTWIADVCVGSLDYVNNDDEITRFVRYWQQRAAKYLAHTAWRVVTTSPANAIGSGFTYAARRGGEIESIEAASSST